jgi:hypothetical protein
LVSLFPNLESKGISEQRPFVNNDLYFWVPRVVVLHRFDCTQSLKQLFELLLLKCRILKDSEIKEILRVFKLLFLRRVTTGVSNNIRLYCN